MQTNLASFTKSPWYRKSQNTPPPLPTILQVAFEKIYTTVMDPKNWYKFQQNLSSDLRQAISTARSLPSQGIGVYLQDKSSRICFASLDLTNQKVDLVLSDETKYKLLPSDMAVVYQSNIKSWYNASKSSLKSIPEDISSFLLPKEVSTPHLKVMIKTNCKWSAIILV